MLYRIYAGLAGGFGGARFIRMSECANEQEAEEKAYLTACEIYDSVAGDHGLRNLQQVMEQDGLELEDAEAIYNEDRENWLSFYVQPVEH